MQYLMFQTDNNDGMSLVVMTHDCISKFKVPAKSLKNFNLSETSDDHPVSVGTKSRSSRSNPIIPRISR